MERRKTRERSRVLVDVGILLDGLDGFFLEIDELLGHLDHIQQVRLQKQNKSLTF